MHPAFFIPTPSTPHRFIIRTRLPCKRHHPSHFCLLLLLPHPLSFPQTFPIHVFNTRLRLSSRLVRHTSPTPPPTTIPNNHLQLSYSTRNTHISSVLISTTYIPAASRIARYALRTTYRHIHKVISVIRPSRKLMGIHTHHTYHTLLTLGADITKKGGEFSFASPIVLPQRYSLYVNVQKLMLYAALLM